MPLSYAKIVQAGSNAKFIWICPGPCSPGKTVLRGECRNSASDYRLSPYMATHFPGRAPRENPQYAGLSAVGKSASYATGSSLIKPNKKMTGIFFGSTTGTTESVAARIAERLGVAQADVHNVAAASVEDVKKYDLLLLGSSTWGSGELQDDWPGFLDKLGKEDLSGRRVALFGCGDAGIYSDTFCDAMAEFGTDWLRRAARSSGDSTPRSIRGAVRGCVRSERRSAGQWTTARRTPRTRCGWSCGPPPSAKTECHECRGFQPIRQYEDAAASYLRIP